MQIFEFTRRRDCFVFGCQFLLNLMIYSNDNYRRYCFVHGFLFYITMPKLMIMFIALES